MTTMDKKLKALDAINKAISRVDDHFTGDLDPAIKSIPLFHLKQLQEKLYEMRYCIETNNLKQGVSLIGIGRVIADSWPYDSVIGNLIIRASQEYKTFMNNSQ